jgi:hypothetical protein
MMQTNKKRPLWRVDWYHRAGYRAPYQLIEAKTKEEAIKLAKTSSRLGDFQNLWSFKLTKLFGKENE